ncbi:MAG: hypothetical protein AAF417_03740 [Pseudomonadota bacterium]
MSKIRKALNILEESQKSAPPRPARPPAETVAAKTSSSAPPAERADVRRGNEVSAPAPVESIPEFTPSRSVEVPVAKLQASGLLPRGEDLAIISQQFRRIKRPIIQWGFEADLATGRNPNVIMVASALPGAGKTFCSFNLAISISSERDHGAVLVDADVLKPGISRELGLQENVGLIDYLMDPTIRLEDILVQTDLNDLVVIPAGQRHPEATELLASKRMKDLVALLSVRYGDRAVVFDMPPLLLTNEAQVLASQAGQIVMVIEARVTSQESALRALAMLDRDKPINAILNKSRSALNGGYQGDDYGYYSYSAGGEGVDNKG